MKLIHHWGLPMLMSPKPAGHVTNLVMTVIFKNQYWATGTIFHSAPDEAITDYRPANQSELPFTVV